MRTVAVMPGINAHNEPKIKEVPRDWRIFFIILFAWEG